MRKTASQILAEVAARHKLTVADLTGPSRQVRYAHPRMETYFEIYVQCPHMSLPAIGRVMGGRDHTSVLSGIRRHCERIGTTYESVRRQTAYYTRTMPWARSTNVPATIAEYREAQRYAV